MYQKFFKRILDFSLALVGLILFSPIIITLIILLIFANRGKPFFFQKRPGKNAKVFTIIKFKTMRDLKEGDTNNVHSLNRITPAGAIIRKYSLDELIKEMTEADLEIFRREKLLKDSGYSNIQPHE